MSVSINHPADSLNATVCANDCKEMEKGEFAQNCTKYGGLFKCCIRRDKMACHECRFCCTLPMCTNPPGNQDDTVFDINSTLELKTQKNELTANEIFFSENSIYKSDDYYCLKPDSHEDPKRWRRYDIIGYRKAFNKKMLDNTATFKYDKYLYNWVDPKVFKAFTRKEKKGKEIWRKTYGFHFTKMIPGREFLTQSNVTSLNMTSCIRKCVKMENSKFAKKCKKYGGYFKCCLSFWLLRHFEEARNQLINERLIKGRVTNICDMRSRKDRCLYGSANGICTVENPYDGTLTHYYYPNMKKSSGGK